MGERGAAPAHGNFDFQHWDPTPVGAYPAGASAFGVHETIGNGWEGFPPVFEPFSGPEPHPLHSGYSADFFDGRHYVMKGARPDCGVHAAAQLPELVPAALPLRLRGLPHGRRMSAEPALDAGLLASIREGPAPGPKRLPAALLYDEVGTALEAISVLPEYGLDARRRADPTAARARDRALDGHAAPRVRFRGAEPVGRPAGSSTPSRRARRPTTSPSTSPPRRSRAARPRSGASRPCGSRRSTRIISRGSPRWPRAGARPIACWCCSSRARSGTGARRRAGIPARGARGAEARDALLLGTDLVKPAEALVRAYDDPLGVTAAFNLNLLARMNRELSAGFDLKRFRHEARWRQAERRIEMHSSPAARTRSPFPGSRSP